MKQQLEKPQQITFDLTDRCQMQCVTCSKWKTVASDVMSKELTTDEWKKALSELRNWLGEGFWFCFSGGEPFLRQDIFEIAEYAKNSGIPLINGLCDQEHPTQTIADLQTIKEAFGGFTKIVKVPQSRFYTTIDLYDGQDHTGESGADETVGGYVKASTGKDINFMIIHKPAIYKYFKHTASDIITPEANQDSDGYIQKFRKYGIVNAYQNKLAGIYLHHKA